MLKNYVKIAWRNLGKHKGDTAINFVGLCVAFTCALLLFLSVFFEFSYDNFHRNKASIYHVYTDVYRPEGVAKSTSLPIQMIPTLKESFPEIQYGSRYISTSGDIQYMEKKMPKASVNIPSKTPGILISIEIVRWSRFSASK